MARRQSHHWRAPAPRWVLALIAAATLAAALAIWLLHEGPRLPPPADRETSAPTPPPGFRTFLLPAGPAAVLDGDTFDADLDGDGRLSLPRERVRLLYLDTPELGPSWKGQDRPFGLPARDFLARLLERRPLVLRVPQSEPTGKYGRTLALVLAGGENVNLALIRAGHSYFDTRFQFPPEYALYAAAEGEAFAAGRGIWGTAASRERYLKRLRREGKTPAALSNPSYLAEPQRAETMRPAALLGRYIHLEGAVASVHTLGKGVRKVRLRRGPGERDFPLVAWRRVAERLGVDSWGPGTRVRVEGFLQTYRGHPELVLHHGVALP